MSRKVAQIVRGRATSDGAGVSLQRIIGQPALPRLDPFLMLDFFGSDDPTQYIAGFPPHPHRGFQTVTYMLAGKMRHRDSVGNEGVIDAGGIQWMNAGRGIIHEEMPQQEHGLLQGFQLWLNLPSHEKMSAPNYQDIPASDVPVFDYQGVTARLLCGELGGIKGPVKTTALSPLFIDISASQSQHVSIPLDAEHNAFLYCFAGSLSVHGAMVNSGELAVLNATDTGDFDMQMNEQSRCIVVAAAPINEPVVQYGPFVMNTREEIEQALSDYQSGVLAV